MAHFKITYKDGVENVVSTTDCADVEACAASMFGMTYAEVEQNGGVIEQLTDDAYYAAIGRVDLVSNEQHPEPQEEHSDGEDKEAGE